MLGCGSDPAVPSEPEVAEPHCEAPPAHPRDGELTLFHVQMESTHNSYHVEPDGNDLQDWAYTMPPLDEQLGEHGVRHFELDIWWNEEAGAFDVYHVPLVDDVTTCPTLAACLSTVRAWSAANPGHHTIFIHIEPKDPIAADFEVRFDSLHATIEASWAPSCLVRPGDVASAGFPTLGESRGKLLITMLDKSVWRDAYSERPIEERYLFLEGEDMERIDDPVGGAAEIQAAIDAGRIVRTRADSGSVEAYAEDTTRLEAALASGAQIVSTDWPGLTDAHGYFVEIPDGTPSRCNPVTAPAECTSTDVEDPSRLR